MIIIIEYYFYYIIECQGGAVERGLGCQSQ